MPRPIRDLVKDRSELVSEKELKTKETKKEGNEGSLKCVVC